MGGLSPELKLRLGDLLIRPVASFGCHIWGVNFLDLSKGVDSNDLERIHLSYLRHVLGFGMNIAGDILRAESCSPPYHVHWTKLIFRLWNSLQSNNNIIIKLIIKGHSLRRACLQPATNTQNSKPRTPTTNAKEN